MKTQDKLYKKIEVLNSEYSQLNIASLIDHNKYYIYSIITHSTAIEGSTLTETDTQILFEQGLTAKGKPLVFHLMNEDLKSAYEQAAEQAAKKHLITPGFLKGLNAMVMKTTGGIHNTISGNWDSSKGEYRMHGVTAGLGGKSYVEFTKISSLIEQLCISLNEKIQTVSSLREILQLSFDAHLNLVTIHPWSDGNGRTARLLMNYIQFYFGITPSKIYSTDRIDYINSLHSSQEDKDASHFRIFMLKEHIKTLQKEINLFKKSQSTTFSFIF